MLLLFLVLLLSVRLLVLLLSHAFLVWIDVVVNMVVAC